MMVFFLSRQWQWQEQSVGCVAEVVVDTVVDNAVVAAGAAVDWRGRMIGCCCCC